MESSLKIALGLVAAALVIGLLGMPAIAQTGFRGSGMMGGGMGGMMGSNFDMNAMHKAMHGDSDYDMNAMHARMLAGNLTQADWDEMRGHCPMMRNWNQTKQ